mgnify:CR=1 FL=1|jgi:L-asparaginase/archaeal Glu-tRNAGln amidotransferase subunit D
MSAPVTVLTTGGTIASLPDAAGGGVRVAVPGAELIAPYGGAVAVREVMLAHSFNLTRADVLTIAERVLAESETASVVVTHGTDTMEETAYLVDLVLPAGRTVVFTGAQRHASAPDADGPRNIADAVRVAADHGCRGLGSVIVMGGRIHAARYAVKAHTLAPDAFASPGFGPLGEVTWERVRLTARPERPPGFTLAELGELPARVDIVPVYLDADGVQVAACREAGARGLVLLALGAGNPTPGVLREVRRCADEGIVVVVASRCAQGPAVPVYGAGGGADLAEAGAVFAGPLPASKARLLLMAALAADPRPDAVRARIAPHLGTDAGHPR